MGLTLLKACSYYKKIDTSTSRIQADLIPKLGLPIVVIDGNFSPWQYHHKPLAWKVWPFFSHSYIWILSECSDCLHFPQKSWRKNAHTNINKIRKKEIGTPLTKGSLHLYKAKICHWNGTHNACKKKQKLEAHSQTERTRDFLCGIRKRHLLQS